MVTPKRLIMPCLALIPIPRGFPIIITQSPTLSLELAAIGIGCNFRPAFILSTAVSVKKSAWRILAR